MYQSILHVRVYDSVAHAAADTNMVCSLGAIVNCRLLPFEVIIYKSYNDINSLRRGKKHIERY